MTTSPSFLFDIPKELLNWEFKATFSDILPILFIVVSSEKCVFSLFKTEREEYFFEFFFKQQTKFFKRNVAWELKTDRRRQVLCLVRLKKQIAIKKKKKSIPLREDEDALVKVVATFVLPRLLFLAPFREEEEEEENTFGGR